MNLRQRARRSLVLALALSMIFGTQAFASGHQDDATVTVAVVTGERALQLASATAGGEVGTGAPTLAFDDATASVPFGVIVSDLAYSRVGYEVSGTLSNLYRVAGTGFDCGDLISSGAFSAGFVGFSGATAALEEVLPDPTAVVQPTVDFVAEASTLNAVLGPLLGTLTITEDETVTAVGSILDVALDGVSGIQPMQVADGAGGPFTAPAAHPDCGGAAGATPVPLQDGTPTDGPDLDTLRNDVTAELETGVTDVASAIGAGLFPAGSDQPGGAVWDATEEMLIDVLEALLGTSLGLTDDMVDDVVDDLVFETISILDLLGQSGAYINVPQLNLDTAQTDVSTGLYHGRLTVTVVDTP